MTECDNQSGGLHAGVQVALMAYRGKRGAISVWGKLSNTHTISVTGIPNLKFTNLVYQDNQCTQRGENFTC